MTADRTPSLSQPLSHTGEYFSNAGVPYFVGLLQPPALLPDDVLGGTLCPVLIEKLINLHILWFSSPVQERMGRLVRQ